MADEKNKLPYKFTSGLEEPFPSEMRRQLWPLCCGASILSGFKNVNSLTPEQLVEQINDVINKVVPDFQVFKGEQMKPNFVFLTLNSGQMNSPKIMNAIKKCGFMELGRGQPRGSPQGFFLLDRFKTWKATQVA